MAEILVTITTPLPNTYVGKPIEVKGRATVNQEPD